jgi:hypothetical protein
LDAVRSSATLVEADAFVAIVMHECAAATNRCGAQVPPFVPTLKETAPTAFVALQSAE